MEYVKPILSVNDFRALANKEDASLLNKMVNMAGRRDLAGMRPFLEFLEIDGFTGKEDLRVNAMTPPASKKIPAVPVIAPERKSIGHALLTILTPATALRTSVKAEMELGDRHYVFLERLLTVINRQSEEIRQPWLNSLLRDACDAVANEKLVAQILAAGAQPLAQLQTRHTRMENATVVVATEALLRGNIPAATALAKHAPIDVVEKMAFAIVNGHETTGPQPEKIFPEAATISEGAAGRGRPPWPLLDAMTERLGGKAMIAVRQRVLTHHLHDGMVNPKDWSDEAVDGLIGELGSSNRTLLTQAIAAEWRAQDKQKFDVPASGQRPWRDLMKLALSTHCSQVLELFPDMLRHDAAHKKNNSSKEKSPYFISMADAIVTTPTAQPASAFQASRFSRTLDLLVEHGFALDKISDQPAAVFLAAKNPSHMLGKLVVLLDKAIDVKAADVYGRTASMVVPVPMKARWDHVVSTHHARARANDVLMDSAHRGPSP